MKIRILTVALRTEALDECVENIEIIGNLNNIKHTSALIRLIEKFSRLGFNTLRRRLRRRF